MTVPFACTAPSVCQAATHVSMDGPLHCLGLLCSALGAHISQRMGNIGGPCAQQNGSKIVPMWGLRTQLQLVSCTSTHAAQHACFIRSQRGVPTVDKAPPSSTGEAAAAAAAQAAAFIAAASACISASGTGAHRTKGSWGSCHVSPPKPLTSDPTVLQTSEPMVLLGCTPALPLASPLVPPPSADSAAPWRQPTP